MKPQVAFMSRESNFQLRGLQMGQLLQADPIFFKSEEDVLESESLLANAAIVFVPVMDLVGKENQMSSRVQTIKYGAPNAWVVVIAEKKISPEGAKFLKKSGAQVVISEDRFFSSIEPEFICSQKIHGQWLPIKGAELKAGVTLPFALYHFMPLNRKFILFAPAGDVLDQSKLDKANKVGEVYFSRNDFDLFQEYVTKNEDKSAAGLVARCRHQYMSAISLYKDLSLLLTDASEQASFQAGKALLDRCYQIADDFVMTLGAVGDSWSVVNNAGFDDITPLDRAPAIGATASLFSLSLGIGNPTQVFLAALIADMGLLDTHPKQLPIVRKAQFAELKGTDHELYQQHPIASVNRVLSRKLPLEESLKAIILATHECVDGKGFPNGLSKEKIPPEAQLIHLAELMDRELKIQEGREREDAREARHKVLVAATESGHFSIDILTQVKGILPT